MAIATSEKHDVKGIVFNLLEEVITTSQGADAWYDVVDKANVSGVYTSLGSYPDAELFALVTEFSESLGLDTAEVLRGFGRAAMPLLADRYSIFFDQHDCASSFILSVNDIIHPEVRKLYSGAGCPHFHFQYDSDGRLIVGYRSPRKLCQLAHGFVEGASDHYRQSVRIEHLLCMNAGDPLCRMALQWES